MGRSYLTQAATPRATPQSEPIPGSDQVPNSGGGYAWEIGPLERLRRFLILGAAGGTFYADERQLASENIANVRAALDSCGVEAVDEIVEVSRSGRAPSNDEAIYALAIACAHKNREVQTRALDAIPHVARTGYHLFMFCEFVQSQRGWGRALKRAVAEWYLGSTPDKVAYQVVKYRQREGWTHADVLRVSKPGSNEYVPADFDALFAWVRGKGDRPYADKYGAAATSAPDVPGGLPSAIEAYERAQAAPTPEATIALIEEYGSTLPWEAIQSDHMRDVQVTEALVRGGMPLGALTRQLGRMTARDALKPMSGLTQFVAGRLSDQDAIQQSRLHPIEILKALMIYRSGGEGGKTSLRWSPVREITDALDAAFYLSFGNVEPVGKRTMLALDVSQSMTWEQNRIRNIPGLYAREAAAAMSLVQANVGDPYLTVAFSGPDHRYAIGSHVTPSRTRGGVEGIVEIDISPRQRLDDVVHTVNGLGAYATDCALPMLYAADAGIEVDTFVIYTDNETNVGGIHPAQALRAYREKTGIQARLAVVGLTATGFSIADPDDRGMLDVVGFDTAAPQVIQEFSAGRV